MWFCLMSDERLRDRGLRGRYAYVVQREGKVKWGGVWGDGGVGGFLAERRGFTKRKCFALDDWGKIESYHM